MPHTHTLLRLYFQEAVECSRCETVEDKYSYKEQSGSQVVTPSPQETDRSISPPVHNTLSQWIVRDIKYTAATLNIVQLFRKVFEALDSLLEESALLPEIKSSWRFSLLVQQLIQSMCDSCTNCCTSPFFNQ